jgi:hypothetical protein
VLRNLYETPISPYTTHKAYYSIAQTSTTADFVTVNVIRK